MAVSRRRAPQGALVRVELVTREREASSPIRPRRSRNAQPGADQLDGLGLPEIAGVMNPGVAIEDVRWPPDAIDHRLGIHDQVVLSRKDEHVYGGVGGARRQSVGGAQRR